MSIYGEVLEEKPKKNVINWGDWRKIVLILILFIYLSDIIKEGKGMIINIGKILLLFVILNRFLGIKLNNIVKYMDKIMSIIDKVIQFVLSPSK